MATPCCPLCRGDLGAGLTPQQSRSRTPALDRFRFSAHRGYAVAEHTSAIRSNASRVRARMMAAPLRPLGEDDGLLGGEEELGITLALVPTDTPGVDIGRRHLPSQSVADAI